MTTDSDLASWNEPPATSSEIDFGIFIDKILDNLGRGKSVNPDSMPGIPIEQLESSKEWVRTVSLHTPLPFTEKFFFINPTKSILRYMQRMLQLKPAIEEPNCQSSVLCRIVVALSIFDQCHLHESSK